MFYFAFETTRNDKTNWHGLPLSIFVAFTKYVLDYTIFVAKVG